ncbi:hypothetical protein SprV_0301347300 [Sparganum proliferum]
MLLGSDNLKTRPAQTSAQNSEAKAVADRLSKLLREYRRKNVITENEWHQMKATDTALARFYGLPKIHKANVPLRPIVALKGSPTYNLAKWMYLKLKFLQGNSTTSVRSASQFLLDLRGRRIQSDEIMVSFDVTSLFTSIPPNLAREVLRKRLEEAYDETQKALKIEHLMRLFEFCQQTFFTFAGETYEQIKGTPIGSPVSGLVAALVLQELEKLAFIQHEPVFWRRYVDDTFVIVKKDMLQHFHSLLNSVFPDIKFTREEEQEQQLPFLDVLVRRNPNGEIETTVYRKATNTTQLLSFHSNHPVAHKRSCVKTLFKRVQTHCSKPEDRAREARYLRNQFVQNGYPRAFIGLCSKAVDTCSSRSHRNWQLPGVHILNYAEHHNVEPGRVFRPHVCERTVTDENVDPEAVTSFQADILVSKGRGPLTEDYRYRVAMRHVQPIVEKLKSCGSRRFE